MWDAPRACSDSAQTVLRQCLDSVPFHRASFVRFGPPHPPLLLPSPLLLSLTASSLSALVCPSSTALVDPPSRRATAPLRKLSHSLEQSSPQPAAPVAHSSQRHQRSTTATWSAHTARTPSVVESVAGVRLSDCLCCAVLCPSVCHLRCRRCLPRRVDAQRRSALQPTLHPPPMRQPSHPPPPPPPPASKPSLPPSSCCPVPLLPLLTSSPLPALSSLASSSLLHLQCPTLTFAVCRRCCVAALCVGGCGGQVRHEVRGQSTQADQEDRDHTAR